jgi:hypothetical protein
MARPTPLAATSAPNPTLPASSVSLAKTTSATLTAADPTRATFHTTSTVRSGRAVTTSFKPSATSRQCPRVSESSDRSLVSEMRDTKAAESRNVTAFTT